MNRWLNLLVFPLMLQGASTYKAEKLVQRGVEVVELTDAARGISVKVATSIGNRAFQFSVHGKNILYFPWADIAVFQASGATELNGIPFLAPWANRMAGGGFWAGNHRYRFNPDLGTVHLDGNETAIHGMLTSSPHWEVIESGADQSAAHVTSRLHFWKYPDMMANWPFAQDYEMTYTLANGVLEVRIKVKNLSTEPMPLVIGFHPYFTLPDVPRAEASVHIPARQYVVTDQHLVATGELEPANLPPLISLRDRTFDDGYTDLIRESDGRVRFSLQAGPKQIEVRYGPRYQVAVIYAPPNQPFVCFEPMTAITNGANLAHQGKYKELQTVGPGQTWEESFWVKPSGF